MRTASALLALLCLAGVIFLCAAHGVIGSARDAVVYTETLLAGERSEADGLRMTLLAGLESNQRWDIALSLDRDGVRSAAEYRFSRLGEPEKAVGVRESVQMYAVPLNFSMSGGLCETFDGSDFGWSPEILTLFNDVAARTKPGKSHTETVRVADYCETLPVLLSIDIAGARTLRFIDGENDLQQSMGADHGAVVRYLADAFSLPVQDDLCLRVTVERGADGCINSVDCMTEGGDPECGTVSVQGDGCCYFTFVYPDDPARSGIYRLHYTLSEALSTATITARPERIAALDGTTRPSGLHLSSDGRILLLWTLEGDAPTLRTYDAQSGAALYSLPLSNGEAGFWGRYPCGADAYAVALDDVRTLLVVEIASDGSARIADVYDLDALNGLGDGEFSPFDAYSHLGMAWDGARLALLCAVDGDFYYSSTSCHAAVFRDGALRYAARLDSSLDNGLDDSIACRIRSVQDAFDVRWESNPGK